MKSEEDNLENLNEPHIPDLIDLLPGEVNQDNEANDGRKTRDILLERYYQ